MPKAESLNPKTLHFEWGGPIGAMGIVIFLPIVIIGLNLMCDKSSCNLLPDLDAMFLSLRAALPRVPKALVVESVWIVVHCIFYLLPVGPRVEGTQLRNGRKLSYNINGLYAFALCHFAFFASALVLNYDYSYLVDDFIPLAIGAILISLGSSIALYVASFRRNTLLALGGNTGSVVYDFFIGRELNPRLGELDFKFVMELRPGLIGWSMLNWAFVLESLKASTFTPAIALVALGQSYYVLEAMWFEAGNLTMMDIVHDGFGYMLMFGDIAWVPFLYTLQCKYLLYNPQRHDTTYLICVTVINVFGYVLFRGANSQKNTFRLNPKDPSVAHLRVMKTGAGKSLIISGFWGICRHPNYVGDWLMGVAWSLFTGSSALIPFFYPIYFGILLMHRQLRDEHHMLEKYGEEDWKKYCKQVPYRLIPYIY